MPDPFVVGSIIQGAGQTAQGIAGLFTARKSRKHQRAMAEYVYSKDLEMWERANRYNAPAAQMQRLKDAGLNPHLVYGSGSVAGQSAGQIPQFQRPDQQFIPPDLQGLSTTIAQYQDLRLKQAQIDQVKSMTRNTDARTATELIRKSASMTAHERAKVQLMVAQTLAPYQMQAGQYMPERAYYEMSNVRKDAYMKDLKMEFQKMSNRWMKEGVTPKDKFMVRQVFQFLQEIGADWNWLGNIARRFGISLHEE